VRWLYRHGWDRQRILDLFAVIDWMMWLPDALKPALWNEIQTIKRPYRPQPLSLNR
jgi:hypothetical protein